MTRYFARVESQAQMDEDVAQGVILDAIRADWSGFEAGVFALTQNLLPDGPARSYWRRLFSGDIDNQNPFDGAPILRIELRASRREELPPLLLNDARPWLEVDDDSLIGIEASVYEEGSKGLFDENLETVRIGRVRVTESSLALNRIFDMWAWPNVNEVEVREALFDIPAFSQLLAIDVGQGGANALIDPNGAPRLYFDVGAGVGGNARLTPSDLSFCICKSKTILLSHWDTDHWAGARADPRLLALTWIAPRQRIGPSHAKLVNDILRANGKVCIYASKKPLTTPLHWETDRWGQRKAPADQWLTIAPCSGKSRNDSGLAVRVHDVGRKLEWLLTGDASYDAIPAASSPVDLAAVTVSHHGARQPRVGSLIPRRLSRDNYARLLYSFAAGNSYGHAHVKSVADAAAQGWRHNAMVRPFDPARSDVLATGLGKRLALRSSIAAGWRRRPTLPSHLTQCLPGIVIVR